MNKYFFSILFFIASFNLITPLQCTLPSKEMTAEIISMYKKDGINTKNCNKWEHFIPGSAENKAHNDAFAQETDEEGNTILHLAIEAGDLEFVKKLTDTSTFLPFSSLIIKNNAGVSPLELSKHLSIDRAESQEYKEIYTHLTQVQETLNQKLFTDARIGETKEYEWLLQLGADPNAKNQQKTTILETLAREGEEALSRVQLLLQYGATPTSKAVTFAILEIAPEILKELVAYGAEITDEQITEAQNHHDDTIENISTSTKTKKDLVTVLEFVKANKGKNQTKQPTLGIKSTPTKKDTIKTADKAGDSESSYLLPAEIGATFIAVAVAFYLYKKIQQKRKNKDAALKKQKQRKTV